MAYLTRYLTGLFFREMLALAAIVITLLYLVQCMRILDVITVKGQDILTLLGQAMLVIPLIGSEFLYICVGIGLTRAFTALRTNGELHIIHASGGLGGMLRAVAVFGAVSTTSVLVLAHEGSPMGLRSYDTWVSGIAADLVGRAMVPDRFTEVVPGVTIEIAGRGTNGRITGFFADDRRDPTALRSYSARSAVVAQDDVGYVLELEDGAVQYLTSGGQFSEIRFVRYDLAVDSLTQQHAINGNVDTFTMVMRAIETGQLSEGALSAITARNGDGLRVIGMCLLITGLTAFPAGRRGRLIPAELYVLLLAFADRVLGSYAPPFLGVLQPAAGGLGLTVAGLILVLARFWILPAFAWLRAVRVAA